MIMNPRSGFVQGEVCFISPVSSWSGAVESLKINNSSCGRLKLLKS